MKFTTEVRASLMTHGMSAADIDATEVEWTREFECLDRRVCPKCGQAVSRRIDPRQAGSKEDEAARWVNYRCTCGYMIDRAEQVGAA